MLPRLATTTRRFQPRIDDLPALPPVDWSAVGASSPTPAGVAGTDLPAADVVVITWADSEWAALEHVFVNSDQAMPYSSAAQGYWDGWEKYDNDLPAHPDAEDWTYWGYYRLVDVGGTSVLLFKSNTHLDWPGESYLADLVAILCDTVSPSLMLSIGTAGGCRLQDRLGTVNVVNAATMYESSEPKSQWPSYASDYSPAWTIVSKDGFASLLFSIPATGSNLEALAAQYNEFDGTDYPLSVLNVNGLVTPTDPPALNDLTAGGTPLLTTSTFVVGTTSGQYADFAVIEMDDAVIARVAQAKGVKFGSVRNVSDPVQNATLPAKTQGGWGSAVYDVFGFYTSFNGALVTWAVIAGSAA